MDRARHIPTLDFALVVFASLAAGIAGCDTTNSSDAGAD